MWVKYTYSPPNTPTSGGYIDVTETPLSAHCIEQCMTKRHVSLPPLAEEGLRAFISDVDERLSGEEDTCDVV